jgi:hypothetical protein
MALDEGQWARCSACKKPIALGAPYYTCSVSTCNRKRTGLVFCSVSCWEVHLPIARHREAWADEQTAPLKPDAAISSMNVRAGAAAAPRPKKRTIASSPSPAAAHAMPGDDVPREVLIIGSRLKTYIKARYGFNVSDRVLGPLSDIVRQACDEAAANARRDERKTVLDRDVPKPRS